MAYDDIDPNLLHLTRQQREITPTLTYQLQVDDIIIEIEHLLRGDVFNEKNEEWNEKPEFKHLNELGIKRVTSVLKTYLNRNEFLTTFDELRILKKCFLCASNLANLFILEGETYEMKEEEYDLILWEIIMPNVEAALSRATNSMTLDAHSKMQATVEHIDRGGQINQAEQLQQQSKWRLFGGGGQ